MGGSWDRKNKQRRLEFTISGRGSAHQAGGGGMMFGKGKNFINRHRLTRTLKNGPVHQHWSASAHFLLAILLDLLSPTSGSAPATPGEL